MFVVKEKFIINLESTQSTNQLCIESGAKIFDEINNTLININSEAQIYLPYNKSFVYFSIQEKSYKIFRKVIDNENFILLFEVDKLNNIITNIKEYIDTVENIISLSVSDRTLILEKINVLEEAVLEITNNTNDKNVDGGYF